MKRIFKAKLRKFSILEIIMFFSIWVILFALLYLVIPEFSNSSILTTKNGEKVDDFLNCLYYSLVTTTTLGTGDISPNGFMKFFTVIQVIGGIIFAGLAVHSLISIPSRKNREAIENCKGWWVEKILFSSGRKEEFYSFTLFSDVNNALNKSGFNFDENGEMHETTYRSQVITEFFPTMLSIYKNDGRSTDYTEGIYRFEFQKSSNGEYKSYFGECFDKEHGQRDTIIAKRITNENWIKKADALVLTFEDNRQIIDKLFPKEAFNSQQLAQSKTTQQTKKST